MLVNFSISYFPFVFWFLCVIYSLTLSSKKNQSNTIKKFMEKKLLHKNELQEVRNY